MSADMDPPAEQGGRRRRHRSPGGSVSVSCVADDDDIDDIVDPAAYAVKRRLRDAEALLTDYRLICTIVAQHGETRVTHDILEAWAARASAVLLGRPPDPCEY